MLIKAHGKRRTIIWKNSSMPINQVTQIAKQSHGEDKFAIWKCATILRNRILSLKSSPLNEEWSAEHIINGEVDIPENFQNFHKILYTGSESGPCSSCKTRLFNSSSADVIFACPGGKLIPGKRLSLELALKSVTGSKSVVSLLNRFGHCNGDETVRRMDMSFEEVVNQNDTILPSHIQISPNLSTGWHGIILILISKYYQEQTPYITLTEYATKILFHPKTANLILILKQTLF